MELFLLIATALSVVAFGFFFGWERTGPAWSAVLCFIAMTLAAICSAFAEARETSVAWQSAFNISIFNAFVLGYTIGYPWKRWWWKRTVAVSTAVATVLVLYMIFIVH